MSGIVGQNPNRGSGVVGAVAIADESVDSDAYVDGSIDNDHIADDAINSEHYAAGSIDEAHIADNAVTLAKMAGGTDGNIISFDASGDPVAIATGSDGEVLTSTGAGSPPAFEAAAGGGKVLQVVSTAKTDTQNGNADSWVTVTGLTQAITPAATSSKVLVIISLTVQGPSSNNSRFKMVRTAPSLVTICAADSAGNRLPAYAMMNRNASTGMDVACMVFLDSPSTTSAVTYGAQCRSTYDNEVWYINDAATSSDLSSYSKGASTITCIEIGA